MRTMYRFALLLLLIGPITRSVALQAQGTTQREGPGSIPKELFNPELDKELLTPKDSLFLQELDKELFNEEVATIAVAPHLHAPKRDGGVGMAHYHKTGNHLSIQFGKALHKILGMNEKRFKNSSWEHQFPEGGKTWDGFWHETIAVPSGDFARVISPSMAWRLPEGTPVVHWYRDPVDLVVSGYRYHVNISSAERWEFRKGSAPRIDAEAHKAIFSICQNKCSYLQLLGAVPEEQGGKIEMLMERQMIKNMVGNLQRWANNAQVLHLSMEHLRTDFNSTMTCLLKFMGLDNGDDQLLMELQKSDHPSGSHVTHGLHDDTAFRTTLEHANWGAQKDSNRALFRLINERQKTMFGCPVLE